MSHVVDLQLIFPRLIGSFTQPRFTYLFAFIAGKWILNVFPHPMTITLCQLVTIAIYTPPLLKCLNIR